MIVFHATWATRLRPHCCSCVSTMPWRKQILSVYKKRSWRSFVFNKKKCHRLAILCDWQEKDDCPVYSLTALLWNLLLTSDLGDIKQSIFSRPATFITALILRDVLNFMGQWALQPRSILFICFIIYWLHFYLVILWACWRAWSDWFLPLFLSCTGALANSFWPLLKWQ